MPTIEVIGPSNPMPLLGNTPAVSFPSNTLPKGGTPVVSLESIQVAGLLPFTLCDSFECREICADDYVNPVFGEIVGKTYQTKKTYENDWNHFIINAGIYNANPTKTTVLFTLEKYINNEWVKKATLNTNAFGIYHKIGSWSGHPSYASYEINWGAVVYNFGMGCYRVKATVTVATSMTTNVATGGTQAYATFILPTTSCLVGKIQGILNTYSGTIPGTYTLNQTDPLFTQAQNVQYIVDLINNGSYPYSATYISANSFKITGESYAINNNILWGLNISSANGCDISWFATMRYGVNQQIVKVPVTVDRCYASPVFELKKWDCIRAHGTVKFETTLNGFIGDPYTDYKKHDLCNMNAYDSIRVRGFFGYEKSPQYLTNNLEWGEPKGGLIEKVNDEQIQRWEYRSAFLPEYIHSRFATFGMMTDKLLISDYNLNNSSYNYKQRSMIYDSGYEPEYFDKDAFWQTKAKSHVSVFFKRGVQSVTKSNCCVAPANVSRP